MIKFLEERGDNHQQLRDLDWQCDLVFLVDFTGKLSIKSGTARQQQNVIRNDYIIQIQAVPMIVDIKKKRFLRF
ncbi:unnamed protein product [Diabrotica balteata]|uniref:Uncharacterized protein n=1 Tax=Diabrotica balteata TaxID=107213 RepID=A0A9N9SUF3_DIABA|nr:unnamed protein product [Diabrotica balteata]